MNNLRSYNDYLSEMEFESITIDIFKILESEGTWTSKNTIEWDLSENKGILSRLKTFLENLPQEKIKKYFIKLMNSLKLLPDKIRRGLIINYTGIFLSFTTVTYLIDTKIENNYKPNNVENLDNKIRDEISELTNRSDFYKAQEVVKSVEGGYSDDKGDSGNWIKVGKGRRFIGTNHGISAPILSEYLGRVPKKEDMVKLTYRTAVKIYKEKYWDGQNLSYLSDQSVATLIYDGCVNQGIEGMREIVSKALRENGIKSENVFNRDIIKKINTLNQEELFSDIKKYRERKYKQSRSFRKHGDGWLNRLDFITYNQTNSNSNV